ncbi:hypothetical protein GGR56DRAFT_676947 [Xylariaceae sp. FL0804]|nr:hypothetical protein GGR56DRAFT_676947 [Xylariaceae sp. FL0804]
MLTRAQTYPRSSSPDAPPPRAWMADAIEAHAFDAERRTCFPPLERWSAERDGRRAPPADDADLLRRLQRDPGFQRVRRRLLQLLQGGGDDGDGDGGSGGGGRWGIHAEARMRRLRGVGVECHHGQLVPTVMLVMYSETEQYRGDACGPAWSAACEELARFCRDRGAEHLAVEVVHYGQLDYGVCAD